MLIIGVDTGGTFTDFIYKDGDAFGVHKRLSTPDDPSRAVIEGVRHIAGNRPVQIVHGSTVATNAILERKGVKTALIANQGFKDVIEIGRQNRHALYDLHYRRRPHIVPRELRFGLPGRITSEGSEAEPFDPAAAKAAARAIAEAGCESVAVCLLFSFLDPAHELAVREAFADLGIPVSLSHEILAEFREFERTSTTVINAYVSPKMTRYLTSLQNEAGKDTPLRIMQSNGGSISADTAMRESVRTILSGPAGGAVGAHALAQAAGFEKIITFDMGGTSTDVALIDGCLPLTMESGIEGYPVKVPMIDIHTVGAGGGSIARLDEGGALRVGPESAGADPGPICYGKGSEIATTDANLFLGRLIPERFLGGGMRLHTEKLDAAMRAMAATAGLAPEALAEGILDVANATMERAIRVISVERGFDPREFALFSFGGAGGLHACFLAKQLSMPRVFIPKNPGILSAIGMIMADVIKDYSRTVMCAAANTCVADLDAHFAPLVEQGAADLAAEGFSRTDMRFEKFLDMRYQGQSFEIITPWSETFAEAFETEHERKYGYRNPGKAIEIVNIRLRARGLPQKPDFARAAKLTDKTPAAALLETRPVIFAGKTTPTPVMERDALLPGNTVQGPAILVEYTSTIVLPPFATANVDAWGNLVVDIDCAWCGA